MNNKFAVHSATLRVATKVKNSVGQTIYNYSDYATFQCYIRSLTVKEKIENEKLGVDATLKLYCDKTGMPFDIGYQIISEYKRYNVVGVNNQIKDHWEILLSLAS
jgi:hypothetical protein